MKTVSSTIAILVIAVLVLMTRRTPNPGAEESASGDKTFQSSGELETTGSAPPALASSAAARRRPADTDHRAEQLRILIAEIESAIGSEDEAKRQRVLEALLASLVALDPTAAAGLLAKIEPGPFRENYLLRLAQLWAARDSQGVLQWASALEDQIERVSTLRSVCLEMAQADPQAAIRTFENLGIPADQSTLANLAQLWASKDVSAATAWALTKPDGEPRDRLVARIAYVMAEQNPSDAANLAVKSIAPGEVQTEAAISIVHRWALQDWSSARAWVDLFPQGPLQERAQHELAGIKAYGEALKPARAVQ